MRNIFLELQDKYVKANDPVSIYILQKLAEHWISHGNQNDEQCSKKITFEGFKDYHLPKIKSVISDLGYSYSETSIKVYPNNYNNPNDPSVIIEISLENTLNIDSIFLDVWNEYHKVKDFTSMDIVEKLFMHWFIYKNEIKDDIKYDYYKQVVFIHLKEHHLPKVKTILSQLGYNNYTFSVDTDAIKVCLESTLQ